jgi:hypothetical protein
MFTLSAAFDMLCVAIRDQHTKDDVLCPITEQHEKFIGMFSLKIFWVCAELIVQKIIITWALFHAKSCS